MTDFRENLPWWTKAPLFHFLLIGVALVAIDRSQEARTQVKEADRPPTATISIDEAVIERLRSGYERQFGRRPSPDDLRGLVRAQVREEVLYREALALGLDRNDEIVRRRLAQQMEFLTEDVAGFDRVADEELNAYFDANEARYAAPGRLSFRHVYFSRDRRGSDTAADAAEALASLRAGADDTEVGDGFLHGFEFADQRPDEVASLFGAEFQERIAGLPAGEWSGPVPSSYGLHLLRVDRITAPRNRPLVEVLPEVTRDFFEERRRLVNEEFYRRLSERYEVIVDEEAVERAAATRTVQK